MKIHRSPTKSRGFRGKLAVLVAMVITVASAMPILGSQQAGAVALSTRSLTLSSNSNAGSAATTSYTFSVLAPTGASTGLRGVEVGFCTTALYGSCTMPTGMSVTSVTMGTTSPVSGGTISGSNSAALNSALASSGTGARVRFQWAADQTLTLPQTVTFIFNAIQNPTTANSTFYARIGFFGNGDTTYTTVTDKAVVAQAINANQVVSFRVQEILQFCVGTVLTTTYTTATANGAFMAGTDCSGVSGTTINMGDGDPTRINVTPVTSATTHNGDDRIGVIMLRTNGTGGTNVNYRAAPDTTGTNHTGALRVVGSTCNAGTVATDTCINSAGTSQVALTAGTELFGMSLFPTRNTTAGSTSNLTIDTDYDGSGTTGTCTAATPGSNCWSFDESGSTDRIAFTTSGATAGVDDEAFMVSFATTPSITTPTGNYQVNLDYSAVSTY